MEKTKDLRKLLKQIETALENADTIRFEVRQELMVGDVMTQLMHIDIEGYVQPDEDDESAE
jgi:hypothetical protein